MANNTTREFLLKPVGIYSFANQFSSVPKSALRVAKNVVIDRENIVDTRRGFNTYGTAMGATETHAQTIESLKNTLFIHKAVTNKIAYDTGTGTFTAYSGTFLQPDNNPGTRIRFSTSNKNIYFTTSLGIYKIDDVTQEPVLAGAPRGLSGTGATTGSSGFLSNNTNVAYRVVWGYKDANQNLILGAPSERIIVSNSSGGTRNISLTFQIPEEVDTTWFYQVYRSDESASLSDVPSDEMQQVYEGNPTSGQITAGEITITDIIANSLRQATLYTSPSQEGIEQANYQPPFAYDITTFKGYTLYANTRRKHSKNFSLIAVDTTGSEPGFGVGDTITFTETGGGSSFTLTGHTSDAAATGKFKVFTAGSPSQNIEDTARSMMKILNVYAANTFLAGYYVSGFDELPGQLFIEKSDLDNVSVAITSSQGNAFTPIVPSSGTTLVTENEVALNKIYISKIQQPEHVPLFNQLTVGSAEYPIQRIKALRDGVIIIKQDGVFRLSGDTLNNFRVSTLDNTIKCLALNSVVTTSNQVFFFSDQGIVAVSDTGSAIVSRAIEADLLTLSSSLYPSFADATFGVAYESDRKYILFTVSVADDVVATQAFVYNLVTNNWTIWPRTQTCGIVSQLDNKLYLGGYNENGLARIYQERKTFTKYDYADESFNVTISNVTGTTVTVGSTIGIVVGSGLKQGVREAFVVDILSPTQFAIDKVIAFQNGTAEVHLPIPTEIITIPIDGGDPMSLKLFQEISYLFSQVGFQKLTTTFYSDLPDDGLGSDAPSIDLVPPDVVGGDNEIGWGNFPWGALPWGAGGATSRRFGIRLRTLVPGTVARCNWLMIGISTDQAWTSFGFNGLSIMASGLTKTVK